MFFGLLWVFLSPDSSVGTSAFLLFLALTEASFELACVCAKIMDVHNRTATRRKLTKIIDDGRGCVGKVADTFAATAVKSGSCWMNGTAKLTCELLKRGLSCKSCWSSYIRSACKGKVKTKEGSASDE